MNIADEKALETTIRVARLYSNFEKTEKLADAMDDRSVEYSIEVIKEIIRSQKQTIDDLRFLKDTPPSFWPTFLEWFAFQSAWPWMNGMLEMVTETYEDMLHDLEQEDDQ